MPKRNTGIHRYLKNAETIAAVDQSFEKVEGGLYTAADAALESDGPELGCGVKQLPSRLLFRAAEVAARLNPVNSPVFGPSATIPEAVLPTPLAAAIVTSKYWGPNPRTLTVSFMDNPSPELRRRILSHLNAWTQTGCIQFAETTGSAQVRIARGATGHWSYLGTDVLLIPHNRPTMNLQGFTMQTSEREFTRVVRHEAGHTLGMPHEHMRKELVALIDKKKAYDYFLRTQGWDEQTVNQQVLTPLDDATILFTPPDQDSIMCYRLPGEITINGKPIRGGLDINATDYAFIGQVYPKPASHAQVPTMQDDWPETEDVLDIAV